MKNMTLEQIAKACGGTLIGGGEKKEIAGAVMDSRQIEKDELFFAIKGERVDGHQFIPQVMEKGAACAVCEKAPENSAGPYILVADVKRAMQDIAAYYRKTLSIPVIGVTGSVGKTSTKEAIASVLGQKRNVLKTRVNYNNEIGVPLTLLRIREEHEAAVIEMGINHFGEMHRLSRMVRPDIAVITNIGQCHLEFLGSRAGILKAKSEIFDYLREDGSILLNGDDDMLKTVKEVKGITPVTFGLSDRNDFYADNIESLGLFGSKAKIHTPQGSFMAEIPLPGGHMLYNALAASAIAQKLGLSLREISLGMMAMCPTEGRSNIIRRGDKVIIDDCYNANPVSMKAALDLLSQADTRKVAILGDMFELGENSKKLHEETGRYAAALPVDVILCVGENAFAMKEGAESVKPGQGEGKQKVIRWYLRKETLLSELESLIKPGDTILIKASHGMGFSEIVENLKEGN